MYGEASSSLATLVLACERGCRSGTDSRRKGRACLLGEGLWGAEGIVKILVLV